MFFSMLVDGGEHRMDLARIRARCEVILEEIEIPRPFDLKDFCRSISMQRGRALHLHALPSRTIHGMPCGMWLATEKADHIFYAKTTTRIHQQHIILHEIGHMLCDHVTATGPDNDLTPLLPDLDMTMVSRVLRRSSYSTTQEQMAEMIATLINMMASSGRRQQSVGNSFRSLYEALAEPGARAADRD